MKITILVENNSRTDNYLLSEPALSYFIEIGNKKILFDTAYSDIILKNAETLNVNLSEISDIVLSHGDNDHTGGLRFLNLKNKVLTAHPCCFNAKIENNISYGSFLSKDELDKTVKLNLSKTPVKITDKLIFLGEIENNQSKDIDDSALCYIFDKGLFIITGCSHSGIINIINHAKKVTKINKIYGILGGLHLFEDENEILETLEFLKKENIEYFAPSHCTSLKSKIMFSKYLSVEDICTGDIIEI